MIVNLRGGLGNQIIQVAYAVNQARQVELNEYAVSLRPPLVEYEKIDKVFTSRVLNYVYGVWRKLLSRYNTRPTDVMTNKVLDGYFQYGNITNIIPSDLSAHLKSQIEENDSVGSFDLVVHVRGGDYLDKKIRKIIAPCSVDYYRKAIKCALEFCGEIKTVGFVTNDKSAMEAIKSDLRSYSGIVSQDVSGNEWDDFCVLYNAKAVIMPNSTFSLTARMLNPSKLTIAPVRWFTDESSLESPKVDFFKYI